MGTTFMNYIKQALFAHFIQPFIDKWIDFIFGRTETKPEASASGKPAPRAGRGFAKPDEIAEVSGNEASLRAFDLPRLRAARLAEIQRERAAVSEYVAPIDGTSPPRPTARRPVPRFGAASLA